MTIALDATGWVVQGYPNGVSGNTATINYSVSNNNSGIIIVNIGAGGPDASQPSFSMNVGTLYGQVENGPDGANNWAMASVHVLLGQSAGSVALTGTNSAGSFGCYSTMAAAAFTGLVLSSGQDGSAGTNSGNSQHPVTGNVTTTQLYDLLISCAAACSIDVWTQNEPSGFTNITSGGIGNTGAWAADYEILNNVAANTYSADYGTAISSSRDWVGLIVAIKGVVPASGSPQLALIGVGR